MATSESNEPGGLDLEGFLAFITKNVVTRREAEELIGRDEVWRLIAEGKIADNPFTERLEVARGTEDYYP